MIKRKGIQNLNVDSLIGLDICKSMKYVTSTKDDQDVNYA